MSPRQRGLAAATLGIVVAKTARAEVTRLIGAEREFPFEMPDVRELTRWYGFALCAAAAAAVAAGLTHVGGGSVRGRWSPTAARAGLLNTISTRGRTPLDGDPPAATSVLRSDTRRRPKPNAVRAKPHLI